MSFPVTPSVTYSPSPTISLTPSNSPTYTPSKTQCPGISQSPTPTLTRTPSPTPSVTNTNTPTVTINFTATPTLTASQTPTNTVTPSTTPPPSLISVGVSLANAQGSVCTTSCVIRYTTTGTIEEGQILRLSNGNPVTGFTYVAECTGPSVTGEIFNLNSSTGLIGTSTGQLCI